MIIIVEKDPTVQESAENMKCLIPHWYARKDVKGTCNKSQLSSILQPLIFVSCGTIFFIGAYLLKHSKQNVIFIETAVNGCVA